MLYTGTNSVVGQLHFRNRLIEERLDCGYQKWGWMKVGGAGGGTGGRQGENWTEGRGRHLVAQMVKNPPAEREIRVRSLDWEDPLEEGMATHSRILA